MHAHCLPAAAPPRVVGLDDWAWKKGRSYGAICVDLERHQPIDLLPDREPATIAAWLHDHPTIEIVARDRGKEFVEGVQHGAPQAVQVADRWHLIKNLGDALEYLFHQHAQVVQQTFTHLEAQAVAGPAEHRPVPTLDGTTNAERSKVASRAWSIRALDRYHQVHALHTQGLAIATIARRLQVSRQTVYRYLQMREPPQPSPTHLRERHVIDPWKPYLVQRWNDGCRNALALWRELRDQPGAHPSSRTVARFLEVLRRDSGTYRSFRQVAPVAIYRPQTERNRPLTALHAKRLWLSDPDTRTVWLEAYRLALCAREQTLADAYVLTQRFLTMARERGGDELDHWLRDAHASGIPQLVTFAAGLQRDYAAVKAALTLVWSNGQTEAQIQRLKLLKRQMYGQAGFPLLRKRVVHREPVLSIQHKQHEAGPAAA
ncbi:MAG: ISL3 family transposase [Herpetosiphonaceae bacterium]|nr:ISL3 family transposase [Herpetosiphonaceae bacterium]